jgi:hypothetical protein
MKYSKRLKELNRIDFSEFPEYLRVSTFLKKVDNILSDRTIRRYVREGLLNSYKLEETNIIFLKTSEIVALVEKYA